MGEPSPHPPIKQKLIYFISVINRCKTFGFTKIVKWVILNVNGGRERFIEVRKNNEIWRA